MNRARFLLVTTWLSLAATAHAQTPSPAAEPPNAPAPQPAQPQVLAPSDAITASQVTPRTSEDVQIEGLDVQPGGLTADETARRALAASSDVQQKRAQIAQAEQRVRQTTIQLFPQMVLRAGYTRTSPVSIAFGGAPGAQLSAMNPGLLGIGACPAPTMGQCVVDSEMVPVRAVAGAQVFSFPENNWLLGANLTVPLSDYVLRLTHAAASAEASKQAAHYAAEAEALRVQTDARALYFEWVRANGQVFIARKALERNQARLEDAKVAFDVGTLTKADLLRLQALVANSQQTVVQAESFRALAAAQLAIIMHDESSNEYRIGEGAHPVKEATALDNAGMRKLVYDSWQRRLELRSLARTRDSLRDGEQAVRAGSYPRLDAVGDVNYANPNQRYFPPANVWHTTWSIGVVASWNIGDSFLNDARGDELAAQGEAVRAQHVGIEAAIANEVVSAQLDMGKAKTGLDTSEVALQAAEEAYRVTTDLFRVGRATTTDLIDAETELLTAKLASTNARIDLTIAGLRLTHATGQDVGAR